MKRETPARLSAKRPVSPDAAAAKKTLRKIDPGIARFYGAPLPGVKAEGLGGTLIVLEGTDGSGRSTQISLLTEWLESQGFAVQTMGLRRSFLVAKDIDTLLAENTITRMTLTLMYATDFFDQLDTGLSPRCGRTSSCFRIVISTR